MDLHALAFEDKGMEAIQVLTAKWLRERFLPATNAPHQVGRAVRLKSPASY